MNEMMATLMMGTAVVARVKLRQGLLETRPSVEKSYLLVSLFPQYLKTTLSLLHSMKE